jgi:hypothetical protein
MSRLDTDHMYAVWQCMDAVLVIHRHAGGMIATPARVWPWGWKFYYSAFGMESYSYTANVLEASSQLA